MTETHTQDSSPTADREAIYERASEAFGILGNETRLQILLALWDNYEGRAKSNAQSFSELRDVVGTRDSGQFTYHLEKLVGEFVRKDEAGYTITQAGYRIVQTMIGSVGLPEPDEEASTTEEVCPRCGEQTELRYTDGILLFRCTECAGELEPTDDLPRGVLSFSTPTRAVFAGRTLLESYRNANLDSNLRTTSMLRGTCPECMGPVERSLQVCLDHDADEGVCSDCGSAEAALLEMTCSVCREFAGGPVGSWMQAHPEVRARCSEYDVPLEYTSPFPAVFPRGLRPVGQVKTTVVSDDPPEARISIIDDGSGFEFTVDESIELSDFSVC